MTACLNEESLVALATGEGGAAERAHLRECGRCAARGAALAGDLATVREVLLFGPLPARVRAAHLQWLPVGGALAATALLALLWAAPWRQPHPPAPPVRVAQVSGLERDVSTALFAQTHSAAIVQPADTAYLEAALNGGWPCGGLGRYGIECQGADGLAYYDR